MALSRREFLVTNAVAAAAAVAPASREASAAEPTGPKGAADLPLAFDPRDPNLKYDLLIAGGTAIDPSQKLHARRDVAVKNGQIARVAEGKSFRRAGLSG